MEDRSGTKREGRNETEWGQLPPTTMSWIQRFFVKILPESWARSMEADSRRWFIKCRNCGFEQSYWDMGGIRWKATGNQRSYMKCINCGKRSWHLSYRKDDVRQSY